MKFLLSINYLIWLALSGVFFAAGEFMSKKFALNPRVTLVAGILVVYSLGVLAWLPAILQKNQLSIVGTIWSVLSLLTTVLIGILLFGEKLSLLGIIGIAAAVVAVALLSLN
jgi:multidrug transporter EmrE-like cation transporter